ncbi:MAG: AAA family ATPase [Saprospiraceae bacterium]|nr:AAA family ATPase [Saprospiraceae bacterium]
MQAQEYLSVLTNQAEKIKTHLTWTDHQKNKGFFELFNMILEEATKDERLNFTTLFSRLAYTGAKYQLKSITLHYSHIFRKSHEQNLIKKDNEVLFTDLGFYICNQLLYEIFGLQSSKSERAPSAQIALHFQKEKKKTIGFRSVVEAVLFEIDPNKKSLQFYDEAEADIEKTALYDVHDKNELFNQNIDSLRRTFTLPIHVNFIDVDIREDGVYIPMGLIIQPDHLVDVTSVSECFKDYGAEPFLYLISKFKPAEATAPLMVGNLVNFILDELISDPEASFNSLLPKMFKTNPMGFALYDDTTIKDLISKLKQHYTNLKYVVNEEFRNLRILRDHIFLEPSFYSRDFGIQGRLDLLHQKKGQPVYDIIELKSGKSYKPNVYGINSSHYIQTLLYDLLIRSAFLTKTKSFNYILYSKENEKPLRFAPPVKTQQYEAMKLRNDILAIEQKLRNANEDNQIITYIKPENFPKLKGFNIKDIELFNNIYSTLDKIEKAYFDQFCAFIAREHALSKTGEHGINKSNGHAALWLESEEEKKERFSLLTDLSIQENLSSTDEAIIVFKRNKEDLALVNFRIGDIGVLYPSDKKSDQSVLKNQIFKCTIINLTSDQITIKLRNKQFNQSLFNAHPWWNIELDSLDSGFNTMYKNIFSWAAAPPEYRQMILGQREPLFSEISHDTHFDESVTPSQSDLLRKMISAKDYFLLWGPPGTGKTSIMLKNFVEHLHRHTKQNILLLAYTNRAVDEMCDAVMSIGPNYGDQFLRLGSRTSTDPRYTGHLLDQVVKSTKSRQEIIDILAEKRIYVSTVSSIVNKIELFELKSFDTVIIDEASQILEPMLVGLLSKFKRFILIGDHKQLPAVVVQDHYQSKISSPELEELGLKDTRTSLFERLYHQLVQREWTRAYGILEQQGRMHSDLMAFPNIHFYENRLQLLPGLGRQSAKYFIEKTRTDLQYLQHRKIFIHSPEDEDINWKTNKHEAEICTQLIEKLIQIYEENGMTIHKDSIGVITPYRAQIALIRRQMEKIPLEIAEKITVDTVERYQGGARDIVIISFCVNRLSQLDTLISLSQEGIDRKLNVALTRAKEQIILIGNRDILSNNTTYQALMDDFKNVVF